ncbi:peptidylprolyl isomerase [Flectobacillus major]|uniref:peptidylprolyl isomerase n=1 Tax=Flectobacillus major TaxID=103 RepID=UPI0009DBFB57|nr:peptidylprolyl isomerase [Flectobacillus major]
MSRYWLLIYCIVVLSACKKDMRMFGADVKQTLLEYGQQNPENTIEVSTRVGNFTIRLYQETPLHRANFIRLVKAGYYNDFYFYRNIYATGIQGGAEWMDRLDYDIPTEVDTNRFKHKRGAVAMAQYDPSMNPNNDTSASEFYIITNAEEARKYDGIYTVVGEVIQGMDVVDKIKDARAFNEKPADPVKFSMKVVP